MKAVGSADCCQACHGSHFGQGPVLAILAMLAPGRLRVAPGGSLLPSPTLRAVAPATPGRGRKAGSLIKQKSRSCATAAQASRFRSVDHDATCGSRAMNYQHPQSRIPTVRRLTKHCSAGSILMRQRPARSGTLLDEASTTAPAARPDALRRGSVVAVVTRRPLDVNSKAEEAKRVRIVGLDIYRVSAEAVMLDEGKIIRLGRIGMNS